eukprot:scaffold57_cov254-Pinguiococcus_pyrenoidosus.AAC.32
MRQSLNRRSELRFHDRSDKSSEVEGDQLFADNGEATSILRRKGQGRWYPKWYPALGTQPHSRTLAPRSRSPRCLRAAHARRRRLWRTWESEAPSLVTSSADASVGYFLAGAFPSSMSSAAH